MQPEVFTRPKNKAARRYLDLDAKHAELTARARQLHREHSDAQKEAQRLEVEVVKARAAREVADVLGPGAPPGEDVKKLERALAKARQTADGSGSCRRRPSSRASATSRPNWSA